MASGKEYEVVEVGFMTPEKKTVDVLRAGEVGVWVLVLDWLGNRPGLGRSNYETHTRVPLCPRNKTLKQVGYLSAAIKSVEDARVGDTITSAKGGSTEALPGYAEAKPMVYAGACVRACMRANIHLALSCLSCLYVASNPACFSLSHTLEPTHDPRPVPRGCGPV